MYFRYIYQLMFLFFSLIILIQDLFLIKYFIKSDADVILHLEGLCSSAGTGQHLPEFLAQKMNSCKDSQAPALLNRYSGNRCDPNRVRSRSFSQFTDFMSYCEVYYEFYFHLQDRREWWGRLPRNFPVTSNEYQLVNLVATSQCLIIVKVLLHQ